MKRALVLWMLLFTLIHSALAQDATTGNEPGWKKIGETNANLKSQNGSITAVQTDRFAAIKLKVTNAPLLMERVLIFYESGELQEIEINNELTTGSETEVFDVNPDSGIQKISLLYTAPDQTAEKAHIELYGLTPDKNTNAYRDDRDREDNDMDEATENLAEELEKAAENVEEEVEGAKEKIDADDDDRKPEKSEQTFSEEAGNAAAEITDQLLVGKTGPEGQNVYIDKDDKCYYINDEGKKVYVSRSRLRDN